MTVKFVPGLRGGQGELRTVRLKPRRGQMRAHAFLASRWGSLRGNGVRTFWSYINNFGDRLTPLLLRHYGCTPVPCAGPRGSEFVGVGSILQYLPPDYPGSILGTGLIDDRVLSLSRARFLALRGRLTAERVSAPATVPLGDPGLLAARAVPAAAKRYALGIVPHYVDKEDPRLRRLAAHLGRDALTIDVQRRPEAVLRDISRCEAVVSSSLHGLVVADAYGIPSAWMTMSDRVRGEGFKFRDYFSALGIAQDPLMLTGQESLGDLVRAARPVPAAAAERADELADIFSGLRQRVSGDG